MIHRKHWFWKTEIRKRVPDSREPAATPFYFLLLQNLELLGDNRNFRQVRRFAIRVARQTIREQHPWEFLMDEVESKLEDDDAMLAHCRQRLAWLNRKKFFPSEIVNAIIDADPYRYSMVAAMYCVKPNAMQSALEVVRIARTWNRLVHGQESIISFDEQLVNTLVTINQQDSNPARLIVGNRPQ